MYVECEVGDIINVGIVQFGYAAHDVLFSRV